MGDSPPVRHPVRLARELAAPRCQLPFQPLVARVIANNQAHGVEPALWKVEGLETTDAAQEVARQAKAGGRTTDLIVLDRDAPAERLDHWLEVASKVDAFVGFAIGRSIWEDIVSEYEESDQADGARNKIAERYLMEQQGTLAPKVVPTSPLSIATVLRTTRPVAPMRHRYGGNRINVTSLRSDLTAPFPRSA